MNLPNMKSMRLIQTDQQGRFALFGTLMMLLVLSACDRTAVVRGSVADVRGQFIPGVAVTVQGADDQTVTDPRGGYTLRCVPGPQVLQFLKSGYTPGRMELDATGQRTMEATQVVLWPLPESKGVYLFENGKFRETTRATPKRYSVKRSGAVLGTRLAPELETLNTQPLIICFKLPPYDIQLDRMEQTEASAPQAATPPKTPDAKPEESPPPAPSAVEKVWVPSGPVAIIATPIDEPDRLLVELRPATPLTPGVYAAHWGAFAGHSSTDPNVYLFRIAEPPAPDAPAEAAAPSDSDPSKEVEAAKEEPKTEAKKAKKEEAKAETKETEKEQPKTETKEEPKKETAEKPKVELEPVNPPPDDSGY